MTRLGTTAVTARGSGAHLVAAAVGIALLAVGMPVGLYLAGTPLGEVCGSLSPGNVVRIWLVVLLVDLVLLLFAGYYSSRRLSVDEATLTYRTWLGERRCSLQTITAVTHQTASDDTSTTEYVAFWSGSGRLFRFNLMGWRRLELKSVFRAFRARRPGLQIDPELSGWFDP